MYLDVKVRLSNKFWARHPVDTVAMWLKCNSTPPFRVDSWQTGSNDPSGSKFRAARHSPKIGSEDTSRIESDFPQPDSRATSIAALRDLPRQEFAFARSREFQDMDSPSEDAYHQYPRDRGGMEISTSS
jgi:hypothetical protein